MNSPLSLEEAQKRLLALAPKMPVELRDTAGCLGHYLASDLTARRNSPPAACSAMDGYAIRSTEIDGPWQVAGESAAGHPFHGQCQTGQAIRISTGALMPEGADTVILQEDVSREGDALRLTGSAPHPPGKHIRGAQSDFSEGTALLPAGSHIGPAQIALALSAGHNHLPVRRAPKIAIFDCGDELSVDASACENWQLPASNAAMLAAMLTTSNAVIRKDGPVPDTVEHLAAALASNDTCDIIVTSGGASVGDHDHIRAALDQTGATIDFWRVAIKPGKPLLVARRGTQLILGLPGNPVSSYVTAYLFLLPLVRAAMGASLPLPVPVSVPTSTRISSGGDRREFLRARWDGRQVTVLERQGSAAITALAMANAIVERPAGAPESGSGDTVPVYLLGNGGIA